MSKSRMNTVLSSAKTGQSRKRKKRFNDDYAYNPKRPRLNAKPAIEGLLNIRCDKENQVVNDEGIQQPLRTTVMMNTSAVKTSAANTSVRPLSPRKVNAALLREVAKKKPGSFGRIVGIEERSANGSPTKVKIKSPTKGSDNVYLASRDSTPGSSISTYSNRNLMDVLEKVEILAADHTFYDSEAYQKIKKYLKSVKQNEVTLQKNKNTFFSVKQDQQSVMHGKAKDYMEATGLFVEGIEWEWLHEIGKMFARFLDKQQWIEANGLQSVDNLVAGTRHANTEMLLVENAIMKLLFKRYPDGFSLRVKANLVGKKEADQSVNEYLHIGWQLEYDIITPDFTLSKLFNLQTMNQPHLDYKHYLEAELKVLMDLHAEDVLENDYVDDEYEMHCYRSNR